MRLIRTIAKHHYIVVLLELLITIILILLFPSRMQAQERQANSGIVFDTESSMPLSGSHVLIEGSSCGTISGQDGTFRLYIAAFPARLKVSHIGFEERSFTLSECIKEETLMLGLQFAVELPEGVTISDKKSV